MVSFAGPAGWVALGALPAAVVLGAALRRRRGARLALRMRPHVALGYVALGCAVVHAMWSMRALGSADARGNWAGAAALVAFLAQAFAGANLLDPGAYRNALRRWHVVIFWSVLVLALAHVVFDAPYLQGMSGAP